MALPYLNSLELREAYVQLSPSRYLPVVLPTLQVLHASSQFTYGFPDFLGPFIHAASLTVLTLQGYTPLEEVREFHFPSLQHLVLLEVTRTVPGLTILDQFQSIERLTCVAADQYKDDQSFDIDDLLAPWRS